MTTDERAAALDILNSLLEEAAPSERPYLEHQSAKYAQNAGQGSAPSKAGQPPPAALKASIDQGYQGLYWYQFELGRPDVDVYWTEFLTQQIEKYERQLKQMIATLTSQGMEYIAPAFDVEALVQRESMDAVQDELRGLRQLQNMTLAWQERHPDHLGAAQSLRDTEVKIAALEQRRKVLGEGVLDTD